MSLLHFMQNNNNTINAKGKSGVVYKFVLNSKPTLFRNLPGVYIFIRMESNQLVPLYIGQTKNLENRIGLLQFKEHHQYECINKNGYTHIATLIVYGGKQKRLDIETDLRNYYVSSTCNQQEYQ